MFGMWFVLVMALGGVANHGFAFAFPIVAFGSVSAMFNPAAAISQVVAGNLGPGQFFTVVAGEMVGAILAGLTIFILYMPQLLRAGSKVFTMADMKDGYKENSRFFGVRGTKRVHGGKMADKATVEAAVNPLHPLEDDDDPFLGIWVSRPASYNPIISFLNEFIMTFMFLFLVNLMTARGQYLYQPSYGMYSNILLPILIGFVICSMILATGPTGFAGNPARDLGPRIAHWLLPIPKNPKVGSEWWYAWVPVIGPLCGGVLAGGLFKAYVSILKGQVSVDSNPWATTALANSSVTENLDPSAVANGTLAAAGSSAAGAAVATNFLAALSFLGARVRPARAQLPGQQPVLSRAEATMAPTTEKKKSGGLFGFGKSKAKADKPASGKGSASAAAPGGSKAAKPAVVSLNATAAAPAAAAEAPVKRQVESASTMHLRKEDAAAAWQSRPRMPSRLMDTYVNYMVLGESGLGKTTFIHNLTSSFKVLNGGRVADGSSTTLSQFAADPDSLKTVLEPMEIPESSRRLMITIQDMPGWGDDINLMRYLRVITTFLLEQRAKVRVLRVLCVLRVPRDYEKLDGGRALGETAMCGQLQHSVTACLYFIPPHRMKKIDLILMAAISQLVTVVPVIGKADAMTERELVTYRGEVLRMLSAPNKYVPTRNLPALEVSLFGFAESILADLGMAKGQLPIAIVSSRESEPCDDPAFLASLGLEGVSNPTQPVRHYRWGAVYPLNRGHSDLIVLKRLLLGDRVESLYAMLDDAFDRYVAFCAAFEAAGKQLNMVVQDTCTAGGPHLEVEDFAKAKVALDSAKAAMSTLSEENRLLAERLAAAEREKKQLLERADDVLAAFQARPRVRSRVLDTYVNYMVLGESGLGKTTFIHNLTSSFKVLNGGRVADGSDVSLSQFAADPDSLRTELEPMTVPECSRRVHISIQDMPGWGDDVNLTRYLRVVATFLLERRIRDYERLDGGRALDPAAMTGQLQHSIAACLYFIPPHRMKKVDLILMAAISQLVRARTRRRARRQAGPAAAAAQRRSALTGRAPLPRPPPRPAPPRALRPRRAAKVPIIPIIAKADCMTDRELAAYRAELSSMLSAPNKYLSGRNLPQLEVSVFNFAAPIVESLQMRSLPLAVSCSRDSEACDDPGFLASLGLEPGANPSQPVRHYRWGAVYPLNRGHSDLIVLKRLLLGDRVESLYAMLDDAFDRYVAFCAAFEENDKQLALIVQDACQAGSPYLEVDNSAKARTALASAKSAMTILADENRLLAERLAQVEKEKAELGERLRRRAGGHALAHAAAAAAPAAAGAAAAGGAQRPAAAMAAVMDEWRDWLRDPHMHKTARLIGLLGLAWASLELVSNLLVRPLFLQLLEGNPRMAGQEKKKASTATQMMPRVVCFIHNIIQVPLALVILADPYFNRSPIYARDAFSTLVMAISAGYFLYDTVECVARLQHEGTDFLLHGVFCLVVFANLTYTGYMHFYGAGFLLWELSTPFMHFRWFLYKIGRESTRLYAANAAAGMAMFFACRILWGNALSLLFWRDSLAALASPEGAALPLASIWFYRLSTVVMNGLNAWWFSKMVRILLSTLRAKKADARGEGPAAAAGRRKPAAKAA
ncbi:glpF [Scenedesmus sp. PABB004]|nr:glpF [Scenedesmus sp. PABB004]